MEKLTGANGIEINADIAKRILSMINYGPVLPSVDWLGTWTVGDPIYSASNPEKPEVLDRATLELTKGEQVLRLPLYMVASGMVVASAEDAGGVKYVENKNVFKTSQLGKLGENAKLLKDLMPKDKLIIPKTVNIHAIEVREKDQKVIINSRYIQGYFEWAGSKVSAGNSWPSIMEYATAISKKTDRDPDLVFEGHTLTPKKGIDAEAPELSKTAVRLYYSDAVTA